MLRQEKLGSQFMEEECDLTSRIRSRGVTWFCLISPKKTR